MVNVYITCQLIKIKGTNVLYNKNKFDELSLSSLCFSALCKHVTIRNKNCVNTKKKYQISYDICYWLQVC